MTIFLIEKFLKENVLITSSTYLKCDFTHSDFTRQCYVLGTFVYLAKVEKKTSVDLHLFQQTLARSSPDKCD